MVMAFNALHYCGYCCHLLSVSHTFSVKKMEGHGPEKLRGHSISGSVSGIWTCDVSQLAACSVVEGEKLCVGRFKIR
jgi:hypothetical protein